MFGQQTDGGCSGQADGHAVVWTVVLAALLVPCCLPCSAPGGQVVVDADTAYSEGVIGAREGDIGGWGHIGNDTVVFSVGYSLEAGRYPTLIPENGGYWAALMATDTMHVSNGFRWNPNLRYVAWGPCCGYGYATIANPDTVWGDAVEFPDSLAPLDSLVDQGSGVGPTSGKWYWAYVQQPWPGQSGGYYPESWNAIFYIQCPGPRHLKLQVAGRSSDTVFVRWAVDSAGNGLFRTAPLPVKQIGAYRARTAVSPGDRHVFDLRGGLLTSGHRSGVAVRRNGSSGRAVVEYPFGDRR